METTLIYTELYIKNYKNSKFNYKNITQHTYICNLFCAVVKTMVKLWII